MASNDPNSNQESTEQITDIIIITSTYLDQETAEQIIMAISSAYLDEETMTSSSSKVIVERMLLLFCSLNCLIFEIITELCNNTILFTQN